MNPKTTKVIIIVGITVILIAISCLLFTLPETKVAAEEAAKSWFSNLDQKQYGKSWTMADDHLKESYSKVNWQHHLHEIRAPFGIAMSRKPIASKSRSSLKDYPEGKYVIVTFETTFQYKKKANETLILKLQQEDTWRVAAYYLIELKK